MHQRYLLGKIIGITGFIGIAVGAFGAHGLRDALSVEMMAVYHTGVLYHLIHSAALLAILCAPSEMWTSSWPKRICTAWLVGIILFSGSLYALSITGIKLLGVITPLGGLCFLMGWFMVIFLVNQKHTLNKE